MFEHLDYQTRARVLLDQPQVRDTGFTSALYLMANSGRMLCPFCGKTWRQSGYHYHRLFAPVVDHVRSQHPEHGAQFAGAVQQVCKDVADEKKAQAAIAKREAEERVHRAVVVTGGFLDEVIGEVRSLINMMEPYYVGQEQEAEALIERLERLAAGKRTPDGETLSPAHHGQLSRSVSWFQNSTAYHDE